jgi:hypothetical protein
MAKLAFLAFAAVGLLPACGRHRGYDPARNAADEQRYAVAECQTSIEVFLPGMRPTRPYRVIGPIEGTWGWTVESRFNRMKKKACELGATAIVDAEERYEPVGGATTRVVAYDRFGRPVVYVEEPRQTVRRTTAIAIVYTDVPVALVPAATTTVSAATVYVPTGPAVVYSAPPPAAPAPASPSGPPSGPPVW